MTHGTEEQRHWFCEACGTFDGPVSGKFCDVCADGAKVKALVLADVALAAVFDAWRADASYKRLAEALRA